MCVAALSALLVCAATAQTSTTYSSTDGKTPAGLQAGNSAGSYALSGFDSISPFSGSLGFRLPLLAIGGRGSAGYTMTLPIEKKWRVEHTIIDPNSYCPTCETHEVTHTYSPTEQSWGATPGYGAGVLQGRKTGKDIVACGAAKIYSETLTRLTFTTPEGTEYELRDQLYGGKPLPAQLPCGSPTSRGTIFVTADGSSATFISDTPILDYSLVYDYPPFYPSGHLLLRDGTRYRINGGHVEWIQDRQGNRVSIGATGNQTQITDSLGRVVTVSYANLPSVPYDEITFAGVGGAARRIRVHYASLSSRLRDGYSLKTYNNLFAALDGSIYSNYNPPVVSSVELPNGRTYNFSYNSYGELARVELPTGGAVEYDFQSADGMIDLGVQSRDTFGSVAEYEISRRVERKRVYGTSGALESRTEFSLADGSATGNTVALVASYNAGGNLLAAEKHYYYGSAYPYLDTYTKPTHYAAWGEGKEYKTETLGADGYTVLRRNEHIWQQRAPVNWWNTNYGPEPANDPRLTQSVTTLADSNQMSKQTFAYDEFNNLTDTWDYDYGAGAPPTHPTRHTHTDYLTINPVNGVDYTAQTGPHLRTFARAQQVSAVNTSTGVETGIIAQSETRFDEYPLLNCDGVGCDGATQWTNPGNYRGNATTTRRWLNTNSTWLENRVEYDQLGNARKNWDARTDKTEVERVTLIEYSAAYKHAYPTHTKSPVPDLTNNRAANTSLESWTAYDFSTGKVVSTKDANNQITYSRYTDDNNVADPLDRLRRVDYPDGGMTKYNYFDTPGDLYVQAISYREANQTEPVESRQYFDGWGRKIRGFLYEGTTSTPWSVTDTYYDAMGRISKVSNPYRVAAPGEMVPASCHLCTTSGYDALGRVTSVTTPDGAQVSTHYNGNEVTVTDQRGKKRKSVTDALGRLRQVTEAPDTATCQPDGAGCATAYQYDVLGNLRQVTQGTQQRYFMYDSLSRLIRVKNPEQGVFTVPSNVAALIDPLTNNSAWSMVYSYDANGNPSTRTDSRLVSAGVHVTTAYEYDNINRLKQTTYNDGTPYTQRTYDKAPTNGRGRFYADYESSATGTLNYIMGYDAMGRPVSGRTDFYLSGTTWASYTTSRVYDKLGHVTQQTYPSGHTANYNLFDAAGRLKKFTGTLGDGTTRTYSTGIEYDEASRLKLEQFGTQIALKHKRGFNVRGQMCEVGLGTPGTSNRGMLLFYYSQVNGYSGCGSGPDNNGNVLLSQHWVPNNTQGGGWEKWFNQHYTYDSLNRIDSVREEQNAQTTTGEQHYTYDRWGNRQISAAATHNNNSSLPFNEKQFIINPATNRLSVPAGQAGVMAYDAAGNLTTDSYTGAGDRTYDAENRMTSAVIGINSSSSYAYDANGKRMRRSTPDGTVWQFYGFDGELLAEYAANVPPSSPQKEYGYRNGELLVTAENPAAAQPVSWMNAVNINAVGSNLLKPATGAMNWNAGAMSTRAIASGDGYVEFSAAENNTSRMLGLSTGDSNQNYTDIDFALYPYSDGNMYVYEQGGYVTNLGPYAASDRYRVSIEAGAIKYRKNGTVVYSSARTPQYPLLADTSFYTPGAGIGGVVMSGGQVDNVGWTNAVGVSAAGNNLSKTGGDGWTSGAVSQGSIVAGDGYAEYTATETNKSRMLGLSHGDAGQNYTDIDFALYAYSDATLHAYEGGAYVGYLGTYASGDRLRVAVVGGQVKYLKNGVVIGASNGAVTYPLSADTALYSTGASMTNVVLSSAVQGGAGAVQWIVTDQLGTPRMVADLTGSLAGVKRHDYLPFGEELAAGTSGRTQAQGYGQADTVRQHFTGKERDLETALDYFGTRHYSGQQGRFTSCDTMLPTRRNIVNPQRWNLYVYVNNNPLALVDPDGRDGKGKDGSRTIDVFINFSSKEIPKGAEHLRAKWDSIVEAGRKAGFEVVIHTKDRGEVTANAIINSTKNSAVTLIVGHGVRDTPMENGRFVTQRYELDKGGTITREGIIPIIFPGADNRGTPIETNSRVGLFTCDASQMTSAFRLSGENSAMIFNDGGADGYTSLIGVDQGAAKFVSSYIANDGNPDQLDKSISAAENALQNSRATTSGYKDKDDKLHKTPH
jgi:RHS repeat-associated protein